MQRFMRGAGDSRYDVAQASRLRVHGASPPRGASNGETPSELAAETAALRRQDENCWRGAVTSNIGALHSHRAHLSDCYWIEALIHARTVG
jgi:hypothetical protein